METPRGHRDIEITNINQCHNKYRKLQAKIKGGKGHTLLTKQESPRTIEHKCLLRKHKPDQEYQIITQSLNNNKSLK